MKTEGAPVPTKLPFHDIHPKQCPSCRIMALLTLLLATQSLVLAVNSERLRQPKSIRLGADQLFSEPYLSWIQGKRVGLITNHTGVDSDLRASQDLLSEHPKIRLVALFGPEHGLLGDAQAGEKTKDGPHVFSLYGDYRAPTPEMLAGVEVLVYDIQDVGVRFYTYISTMLESMKAASGSGIPFIVLDRPNVIDATRVEGPVLERGFESFVGIYPIPIRYGMTVGELARFFAGEMNLKIDLRVVPLVGLSRKNEVVDFDQEWIAPSPNMPTQRTALLYPGFCLTEGTNLSEGRGTTRPFELIGAPWLDSKQLAKELNSKQLPGVFFRPQVFTPTFSKYQGQQCQGIQIHVLDEKAFQPIPTALHFFSAVQRKHPDRFEIRGRSFDRLAGNSWIRTQLIQGKPVEQIEKGWQAELNAFRKTRDQYLLY